MISEKAMYLVRKAGRKEEKEKNNNEGKNSWRWRRATVVVRRRCGGAFESWLPSDDENVRRAKIGGGGRLFCQFVCCSTLLYITARPSRVASFLSAPIKNTTDAISSLADPVVLVMPFFLGSVSLERETNSSRLFLFYFIRFRQVPRRQTTTRLTKAKTALSLN